MSELDNLLTRTVHRGASAASSFCLSASYRSIIERARTPRSPPVCLRPRLPRRKRAGRRRHEPRLPRRGGAAGPERGGEGAAARNGGGRERRAVRARDPARRQAAASSHRPAAHRRSQGDLLYYVMPHIAGESLRSPIHHQPPPPVGETVRILRG